MKIGKLLKIIEMELIPFNMSVLHRKHFVATIRYRLKDN